MIKEMPIYERPREKMEKYGVQSLSNQELLAIIIKNGTKGRSVMDLAQEILYSLYSLSELKEFSMEEIKSIKGIGKVKALEIIASIELGKRIICEQNEKITLSKPLDIYNYLKYEMNYPQEHFWVLYLDNKCHLITKKELFIGTNYQTIASPNEIFRWALKLNSQMIIIAHNHPSGDPIPSLADKKLTKEIYNYGKMLDIILLDHIIIGNDYFSFNEHNMLE